MARDPSLFVFTQLSRLRCVPALLLTPLVLAGCGTGKSGSPEAQFGYIAQMDERFDVRFRTNFNLSRPQADGRPIVSQRLHCDLDDTGFPALQEPDRRRYFDAPIEVVRRAEGTPDGHPKYRAAGHFTLSEDGAGERTLSRDELAAIAAVRASFPCRVLVAPSGGPATVAATMDMPSTALQAALGGPSGHMNGGAEAAPSR